MAVARALRGRVIETFRRARRVERSGRGMDEQVHEGPPPAANLHQMRARLRWGTFNLKTGEPAPVTLEHLSYDVYTAQEV
jgi:hypothetical protein